MEIKLAKGFRIRRDRIWISRGIFIRIEKKIWRRGQKISKDSKT